MGRGASVSSRIACLPDGDESADPVRSQSRSQLCGASTATDHLPHAQRMATMATQLGLDPAHTEMTPVGRPISVTDGGTPIRALLL
jgi:hypothetical protein